MPGKPNKKEAVLPCKPGTVIPADTPGIFASIPQWLPVAILILTALVYSRVLYNDFVSMDDDAFILKNPLVRNFSWEGVKEIFTTFQLSKYQPFVNLSFLLEYRFFGFNPVVFHLTNVLLHIASTWVVYKFTERLSGKQVTAIVVAVLFAIHPMHVEEVAWAAERKDVLYSFFYLLALLEYMKYLETGFQVKQLTGVFLFFLAAMFSKSAAMTLPLILVMIDIYKGRKLDKKALLEKLPFILIAILFAVLSLLSQQSAGPPAQMPESINFINRIFLFTYVPSFYIIKLIVPVHLTVMYYYPDVTDGLLPWQYYASLPFFLFITWAVIRPSRFRREMIFGASFFVVTIFIMEQIIAVGPSFTPERYTYIPYLGFFYIIGQWLSNVEVSKQKNAAVVFLLFLIFFCGQTWARIGTWKNSNELFKDVIQKNADVSNDFNYYFVRGDVKANADNIQGAIEDYDKCLSLNPGYAEAYTNRGAMYFKAGDLKSALHDFSMAINLNPKRGKPYEDKAGLEATTGDFAAALKDFDRFLEIDSNDSRGYTDRGMVHMSLKDSASALKDWRKAANLGNHDALNLLRQCFHVVN